MSRTVRRCRAHIGLRWCGAAVGSACLVRMAGASCARESGRYCPATHGVARLKKDELLPRGILLLLIGAGVLLGPLVLERPGLRELLIGAQPMGWVAIALGVVMIGAHLVRRLRNADEGRREHHDGGRQSRGSFHGGAFPLRCLKGCGRHQLVRQQPH